MQSTTEYLRAKLQAMFNEQQLERANKYLQKIAYYTMGYPRYTERDIETKLMGPNPNLQELRLFRFYSTRLAPSQVLWFVCCLSVVSRECFYFLYTMAHFSAVTANVVRVAPANTTSQSQRLLRIGCLETNCIRLSNENIEQELKRLPLMSICLPSIDFIFTCLHNLDSFGLQVLLLGTYCEILVAIGLPLRLYLCPSSHESAMYTVAPQTILRANREQIRKELVSIHKSLINFYQKYVDNENLSELLMLDMPTSNNYTRNTGGEHRQQMRNAKLYSKREADYRIKLIDLHRERYETDRLSSDISTLNHQMRAYIDDCLPLTRCEWWRKMAAQRFCLVFGITFSLFIGAFFIAILTVFYMNLLRAAHLAELDEYILASNCAIWYHATSNVSYNAAAAQRNDPTASGRSATTRNTTAARADNTDRLVATVPTSSLRLAPFAPALNTAFFVVVFGIIVPLSCTLPVPLAQAMNYVEELYMRIAESMSRLQLTIEYTLMLRSIGAHKTGSSYGNDFGFLMHDCEFDLVRRAMQHNVVQRNGLVYLRPFKRTRNLFALAAAAATSGAVSSKQLDDPFDEHNFVHTFIESNLAKYGDNLDPYLGLVTKTLLNIKLLNNIIQKSANNLANFLWLTYALNYGSIIIIIAQNRKSYTSSSFPVVVGCIFMIVVNFILSFASSIQTKSKKVMLLMWQLIAASSDFTDIRVKHMRHLLIRQVALLSQEGGMSLKAFGFSVTYARVIEVTLWTFTLIVIAFNVR